MVKYYSQIGRYSICTYPGGMELAISDSEQRTFFDLLLAKYSTPTLTGIYSAKLSQVKFGFVLHVFSGRIYRRMSTVILRSFSSRINLLQLKLLT